MTQKDIERFWSYVNKSNSCWEWLGGINSTGRGMFWLKNNTIKAHRVSWNIHFGEIPKDMCVLHKCDNGKCVNPSHLFIGTYRDNTLDMIRKNRHVGNRKINKEEYFKIATLFKQGLSRKKIASIYKNKIGYHHICKIIKKSV